MRNPTPIEVYRQWFRISNNGNNGLINFYYSYDYWNMLKKILNERL